MLLYQELSGFRWVEMNVEWNHCHFRRGDYGIRVQLTDGDDIVALIYRLNEKGEEQVLQAASCKESEGEKAAFDKLCQLPLDSMTVGQFVGVSTVNAVPLPVESGVDDNNLTWNLYRYGDGEFLFIGRAGCVILGDVTVKRIVEAATLGSWWRATRMGSKFSGPALKRLVKAIERLKGAERNQ